MELDNKTLEMIIETRNDVKHILKALDNGAKTFQEHTEQIQELKSKHQLMKGKLSVVTKLATGTITVVSSFVVYLWFHLINR